MRILIIVFFAGLLLSFNSSGQVLTFYTIKGAAKNQVFNATNQKYIGNKVSLLYKTDTVAPGSTLFSTGSDGNKEASPFYVQLMNFTVIALANNKVKLSWQTASEINNRGFEVQRSFDGCYFTAVQFVNGAGNSNDLKQYITTDVPGREGRIYYCLKQIDQDGNGIFSDTLNVLFDKTGIIKIFPNPARQSINISNAENYSRVKIVNTEGQLLEDITTNRQYLLNIDISKLGNGIYLLQLISKEDIRTERFVVAY